MSEKTSTGFTLTLKANEEMQLLQTFQSHSSTLGHMYLADFIRLCFTKQLVKNSTAMHSMLNAFQQAAGDKIYLNKDRFFFCINLLSRLIYPEEIMPLDFIITRVLTEFPNDSEHVLPSFDEKMKLILNEGIIRTFEKAEEGFFNILMAYNTQNIINSRKVVGIQQIKAKNIGISPRNLVRFLKSRKLFPSLFTIEDFQRTLEEVLPGKNKEARKYYSYGFLLKFYEKDQKDTALTAIEEIKGEPEIVLSSLQLILARLALSCYPEIEDPVEQIYELLEKNLHLISDPKISVKYSLEYQSDSSLSDVEDSKKILQDYYNKKFVAVKNYKETLDISTLIKVVPHVPTIEEIEKMFDDERVPVFPVPVTVVPENPPPYVLPPIQYPIKSVAVDKKESPKKDSKNRSETPAVKVKFAELPGRFTSQSPDRPRYESFAEIRKNLNGSLYPETTKQMLANPAIQPCLIREVFMPPNAPPSISSLIESCFAYQSNSNYHAALTTLLKARNNWASLEKTETLKADIELFFEMAKGAIFESCKKDQLALGQYFSCKLYTDRLSFSHPDRALLYCGLGSVLTHLGHYRVALRSFLMAKKIRERCIGGDTIETATVYNNLGVCMYYLGRYQEAFAYFELAEAIFTMMLGPNHARSLTAKQNINKVKRQNLLATPDYRLLWSKQFVDPYPKKKKKGKGKKKKGKK